MSAFIQIFSASFEDVKNYFPAYFKYLLLPFIALVSFEVFSGLITIETAGIELAPATETEKAVILKTNYFLTEVLQIIIYFYFDINLAFLAHKITLGKQKDISIIDGLIWRRKHFPFIKAFLVLVFIFLLFMAVPLFISMFLFSIMPNLFNDIGSGFISTLFLSTFFFPSLYLFGRFCLLTPAAAAIEPLTLSKSFSLTKGFGWIIFTMIILLPVLVDILFELLPSPLSAIFIYLSLIFFVILLTNSYKHIIKSKQIHENT